MPEEAVAFSGMKRDVVYISKNHRLEHNVDSRPFVVIGIVIEVVVFIIFPDEVVHVVLKEGQVRHEQVIRSLRGFEIVRISKREIERVTTNGSVGIDLCGVEDDFS